MLATYSVASRSDPSRISGSAMTSKNTSPVLAQPLSYVEFHVLIALAEGPLHGYGIMLDTEERTAGRVTLEPGNLYRALKRMRARGLVDQAAQPSDAEGDDERRRYYRITDVGRRVAADEAHRMSDLVASARARQLVDPEAV
jgi:DNA-binding PadR family transcriptional regulator